MNLEINIIIITSHVCALLSSVNSINHSNSSVRFCIMEFINTIGHKLIISCYVSVSASNIDKTSDVFNKRTMFNNNNNVFNACLLCHYSLTSCYFYLLL